MTQIDYVILAYVTAAIIFGGATLGLWRLQRQLQNLKTKLNPDDL